MLDPKKTVAFTINLVVLSAALFFTACKQEQTANTVPNVGVDIYITVSDPQYFKLNAVNGSVDITGGARGIIVWRKSTTEFLAYDRTCTYQSSNANARVDVDKSGIMAVDTICKSKFLLVDGSVQNPPATVPLKHYETSYDGTTLHIYSK